jgi:hypothetical protein
MGDTQFFNNRVTLSGSFKACLLYVLADVAKDLGQQLQQMDWSTMDTSKTTGWALFQIGGIAILVKAFYSNSSPTVK